MSFPDFVDLVVYGAREYQEFLEENGVAGESMAVDTGMIDGKGRSRAWSPYWKACGVCSPAHMPQFILHMDHFTEDAKVRIYKYMTSNKEVLRSHARYVSLSEYSTSISVCTLYAQYTIQAMIVTDPSDPGSWHFIFNSWLLSIIPPAKSGHTYSCGSVS